MGTPSPFDVSRTIGTNLNSAFNKVKDENAIENILSQVSQSQDPAQLQGAIGKILSQVSPERRGDAIQYLQNAYNNVQKKQELAKEEKKGKSAAKEAGYTYGVPPQVAAQQLKDKAKSQRLAQYGLGQGANQQGGQTQGMQTQGSPTNQVPESVFKKMSEDQLVVASGAEDKEVSEPAKAELKRRQEEVKEERADVRERRKETLPLRQAIIEEANLARQSIQNKNHLIDLIDRGNINDPTFAIFAESLPFNLGKRMLSDDTVEYKGGLVDEFGDLKNIFKGATRVKEVEIYENKLADLYLNDSQKKAILKSRINASKVSLIREEAASEVEEKYPNISALQFNKKVDEIAKPKIDKLFNSVWDEQKSILDQAEKRKELPLDPKDPEDASILKQILKEANGNKEEARKIASKKGYKF